MKFHLVKMQGCGNDFLFLDLMGERDQVQPFYPGEVQQMCHRQFGLGADGLVVLKKSDHADAAWDFYNSDGSTAEMCGNAARCAVKYLVDRHFPGEDPVSLETGAGVIKGKVLSDGMVEITLFSEGNLRFEYTEKIVSTEKNVFNVYCINTGVPHAVLEVKDILSFPITSVGRLLVGHPAFGDAGSNITFYQRIVGNRIRSTTFERGVEEETFACGTGAAAAALVYSERYMQALPIEVVVPGGELIVDMSPVSRMHLLRGPAEYVFTTDYQAAGSQFEAPRLYGDRRREKPVAPPKEEA